MLYGHFIFIWTFFRMTVMQTKESSINTWLSKKNLLINHFEVLWACLTMADHTHLIFMNVLDITLIRYQILDCQESCNLTGQNDFWQWLNNKNFARHEICNSKFRITRICNSDYQMTKFLKHTSAYILALFAKISAKLIFFDN